MGARAAFIEVERALKDAIGRSPLEYDNYAALSQAYNWAADFDPSYIDDALATADALKTIAATGAQPILAGALAHFPSGTPAKDRKDRQAQIAAMPHGAREFDVETLAFHDPAVTAETCDRMLAYGLAHAKELKLEPSKAPQDASADSSR